MNGKRSPIAEKYLGRATIFTKSSLFSPAPFIWTLPRYAFKCAVEMRNIIKTSGIRNIRN